MTLASIVVNNHNYARYLRAAIDSALAQSWSDTEVIVVDDGSSDESRQIIEEYGSRVGVVLKENGGQASALNAGFAVSSGDLVLFLDSDDLLEPDVVERVVGVYEETPDVARIQWPMHTIDSDGRPSGPLTPNPAMMAGGDLSGHIVRYRTHVWPATSGNAYPAAVLRRLLPVPSEFDWGTDMYLAETTPMYGPVVSLPQPGGSYRVHGGNYWTGRSLDLDNIRERIRWTVRNHEYVRAAAGENGIDCPADPTVALDVAFLSQRLASLRLDPGSHPVAGDTRLKLVVRGLRAAVAHPHHTVRHKAKRVIWLLGVGLGPKSLARKWVERFYFPNRT